jgi:quercetin dioxygenase-like cupin family protein
MTVPSRGLFVAPGEGARFLFNGTERQMKATAKDTQGHLTAFESSYPAGVPHPLHIHHDAIESFYMLEGTCRILVGDEVVTATQGAFVSVPRGVTHGFVPIGGAARALVMFTPAAMEGFWEELHFAAESGSLDQAKLETLRQTYHLESIGPFPQELMDPSR